MYFKKVYLEISDNCGLCCSFCPHPKNTRGVMSLELFEKILSQLQKKTHRVCLHVLGDPCRVENLGDYLMLLSKYHLQADIVTSGYYLMHKELLLSSSVHQVAFSLDAGLDLKNPQKKSYLKNILDFCSFRMQSNSKTFINLRLQEQKLDFKILSLIFNFFGYRKTIQQFQKRIKLAEYIFLHFTKTFEWADINTQQKEEYKYCHALKEQIAVLANGVVVPCCIDATGVINLGNIKNTSLTRIYHSLRAKRIKEGFAKGQAVEELCKKCAFPTIKS